MLYKTAVCRLLKALENYRGGLIPVTEVLGKEHPLHYAVRQVERFHPKKHSRRKQYGSLKYPINMIWYSLLDHSRVKRKQEAMQCRDILISVFTRLKNNEYSYQPDMLDWGGIDKDLLTRGCWI
ncbi:MAG: hypothetical protein ABIH23_26435 [bacterium]